MSMKEHVQHPAEISNETECLFREQIGLVKQRWRCESGNDKIASDGSGVSKFGTVRATITTPPHCPSNTLLGKGLIFDGARASDTPGLTCCPQITVL
jgi:hypothetical protein